jgi:excisionase family DNA binding protein
MISPEPRRRPYRVPELAAELDVDKSTVYRMISAGRIRAERHGTRRGAIRVPVDAVADYLQTAAS